VRSVPSRRRLLRAQTRIPPVESKKDSIDEREPTESLTRRARACVAVPPGAKNTPGMDETEVSAGAR
jgi:DNA gyrase inhibitor GyrI